MADSRETRYPLIVKAAIQLPDGRVLTGWRHARIIQEFVSKNPDYPLPIRNEWQGFIDAAGAFWNRGQSCHIAYRNGQLPGGWNKAVLLSEDLWNDQGEPV